MYRQLSLSIIAMMFSSAVAVAQEHESPLKKILPPDDQEAMRSERSVTVGIPLVDPYNLPGHFQWRPTGHVLLGLGYDASLTDTGSADLGHDYRLTAHQHSTSLYVQYSPLKNSGFFVGVGGEERFGTFTINKRAVDSGDDQLVAHGSYQSFYAGPTFGWTWIWANGVTFGFDVSKRKRFTNSITVENDMSGNPTALSGDVSAHVSPDTVLGSFMLGYSL
jgi:hypothetical protein